MLLFLGLRHLVRHGINTHTLTWHANYRRDIADSPPRDIYAWGLQHNRICQKLYPLISTLTLGHIRVACISPPGKLIIICFFIGHFGILCSLTNRCAMKECEAPESNKTNAGLELTRYVHITTSWASCADSVVTWLTLPCTWFHCFWFPLRGCCLFGFFGHWPA